MFSYLFLINLVNINTETRVCSVAAQVYSLECASSTVTSLSMIAIFRRHLTTLPFHHSFLARQSIKRNVY